MRHSRPRCLATVGQLRIAVVLSLVAILPAAVNAAELRVKKVAVECNGSCGDSTLAQICGSAWTPIAVDCSDVRDPSSSSSCGGNNRCSSSLVSPSQVLGAYCDNVSGYDANVYCTQ